MNDRAKALDEEIAELKAGLQYRRYIDDLDFVSDDLDRLIFQEDHRKGRSYYEVASQFVEDAYYECGEIELLVNIHLGFAYRHRLFYQRILDRLVEDRRVDLFESMWNRVLRDSRAEYLYQRAGRPADDPYLEEVFAQVLEAHDVGIETLERLGRRESIEAWQSARTRFATGDFRRINTDKPIARKIDEAEFWNLLSRTSADTSSVQEHEIALGQALTMYKAVEIKRFQSLYAKRMRALYHWNVWALAYAARDGCSEPAFEAFRSWLVLRADPALLDTAIKDPAKAAHRIEKEPELPDGSLLHVIAEAYWQRKGEPLEPVALDLDKPKGKEWPEARLAEHYPELSKYYHYTD